MASPASYNLEHATLVSLTDKIVLSISMDCSTVAQKLIAINLIPTSSISSSTEAADIFDKVLKAVEIDTESYKRFLAVINDCPHMRSLTEKINKTYEEKKQQQTREKMELTSLPMKIKPESARTAKRDSESDQEQENKFPYLEDENMTKEERDRRICQLKFESSEMKSKFAILVDRTREALEIKNIAPADLEVLVMHCERSDMIKLLKKKKTIRKLFCALSEYWSFFDYEFLSVIIERHCPELKSHLNNYEADFKTFCKRRLCEIPSDIFRTKKGHRNNLYVKYNQSVYQMKLETAQKLELKLSALLKTTLYLLEVNEGCVELVFDSFCNLDEIFPLSSRIKEQLGRMGVIKLENGSYTYTNVEAQNPLAVKDKRKNIMWREKSPNFPGYGKWLIFRNFEELEVTWKKVCDELESGRLKVVGALCSTVFYDPLRRGTGPQTTGRIAVYTNEEDYIDIGMQLVQLVEHDIKYKTTEDAWPKKKFAHFPGINERPTSMTIFWNDCNPYASVDPRPGTILCPAPQRDDRRNYDPAIDRWKLNIVEGETEEHFHGKWILVSNYDDKSDINITSLWHKLKDKIEAEKLAVIKMECPASEYRGAPPEIHVSTSQQSMTAVGMAIISIVKHDIRYTVGEGLFHGDMKTLYWNPGSPSYEDARHSRSGITGNWRD